MSTEEAEGEAVYGGRVPPNQHKKKRRKKRRHGQATEAESAAAEAAAAAAAAAATAPRGKKARSKRSGGSADAAAEAAEAVADQQQVMVGAVVPKDMCAGQIMAVSVGEDRQLYVKIPLSCQAFDGLRIQVPDLLWADLPPVRDEDAPDTSSGNAGGGGGGGGVAVGARADEKEEDDQDHSSGGKTKKQKKKHNKKNKKVEVEVEAVALAQEAAARAVGGAKPADPSFFSGKGIVSAGKLARARGLREYSVRLADVAAQDGADFGDSLAIALRQARVVGGKYRYGSVLVSGADFCPAVSGGSNYAKYGHKKIHAELCSLKGLSPQAIVGKDVIIARLAPTDKFCSFAKQGKIDATSAEGRRLIEKEKLLNARPCANCQAAMVRRGIRRVFFTRGHGLLGVLELNVFATVVEKLN